MVPDCQIQLVSCSTGIIFDDPTLMTIKFVAHVYAETTGARHSLVLKSVVVTVLGVVSGLSYMHCYENTPYGQFIYLHFGFRNL